MAKNAVTYKSGSKNPKVKPSSKNTKAKTSRSGNGKRIK